MRRPACFYGRCQNEEERLILKAILERIDRHGYSESFKEKEIFFQPPCVYFLSVVLNFIKTASENLLANH